MAQPAHTTHPQNASSPRSRVEPDNLKTGVDRPDLYDPKLNRAYDELRARRGFDREVHGAAMS